MRKKKIYGLLFLLFIVFSLILSALVSAIAVTTREQVETSLRSFFETPGVSQIIGIVFGIWDIDEVTSSMMVEGKEKQVTDFAAIIIYLVIWFIFLFAFSDIVAMFAMFSDKISWIIGLGITIIAAQLGFFYSIGYYMSYAVVAFGAFAIWAELILVGVLFFLASFGLGWAKKFALQRRAFKEAMSAEAGGKTLAGRIKGLSEAGKALEKI